MRKSTALLLVLVMLGSLMLSGFTGVRSSTELPVGTESAGLAADPSPAPEQDRSLSWSRAFADNSLPEGSLTPEEIAFYRTDDEGKPEIVNVPKDEVQAWWDEQESLPRTRFFEQFMPESLQELFPILDYAFAHSYSRFCVPSTSFTATDIGSGSQYLSLTYRINNAGLSTLTPASFDLGGGKTLHYVTVTLRGMDRQGVMSEYQQSLAAAREVVAGIPEGSSEYDRALYIYNWLTENVVYDYNDYYESNWNLLYDTMIRRKTVCAGYTEALYVMYNLAGIECFTVWGSIQDSSGWGDHIWNVAKIDGEYYQFDSTWDAGVQPSRYCFFGVSLETMQFYYPRLIRGMSMDYCPPCTKDLPLPPEETAEGGEMPEPGTLEDGVYSQPFFDLRLNVDESWRVLTREEINEEYYGGLDLSMEKIFRMGGIYTDLMLTRAEDDLEITLEQAPLVTADGQACDDVATFVELQAQALQKAFEDYGLENCSSQCFRTEICGREYEALSGTGSLGDMSLTSTFYCAERDGYYLMINIISTGKSGEMVLADMLPEEPSEPEPDRSLSWSKAFSDTSLPEGSLTPEEIAFYQADDEGNPRIVNVPREEVLAWWNEQESLPRTHYYEQFMSEKLQELYPILDYAFAHSYSRFCVPTASFTATDISGGWKYLPLTYRINNNGINTLTPAVFDLGEGKTLQYVTVTLKGMDKQGLMSEYQEALAAAREIVASVPEGSSEYETALYLYQWLTDNVEYFSAGAPLDYYETEWNLLYDTLVKHDTVCAGYAEALYVLYNLAGIECITVTGALYDGAEWMGHAWNAAKIDGDYYLFDSTLDQGFEPANYGFFGVSDASMQDFFPRLLFGDTKEYIPECTKDLPLPDGGSGVLPEGLQPGAAADGVYSQPFWNLRLALDESWTVYSRDEIGEEYYGSVSAGSLSMEKMFRLGAPYMDLIAENEKATLRILLERGPVRDMNGERCDTPADYADKIAQGFPEMLEEEGVSAANAQRFQIELGGRSYECLGLSLSIGAARETEIFCFTERDGFFLTIGVVYMGGGDYGKILSQVLTEP